MVLLTVPAHVCPSTVGEIAGVRLELDTNFPALVVDRGQLGAGSHGDGMLLLVPVLISAALLALHSLLYCQILFQSGPWGKGTVKDLMVEVLALETSACQHLSSCSIEGRAVM